MERIKEILKNEEGTVLVIVCLALVLLLGLSALVIDYGVLALERRKMVTAADAGALAGVRVLLEANSDPSAKNVAKEIAREVAIANGADSDLVSVSVDDHYLFNEKKVQVIIVNVGRQKDLIFSGVLNLSSHRMDVKARAVGTWGYVASVNNNFLPLYIQEEHCSFDGLVPLHLKTVKAQGFEEIEANWGVFGIKPVGNIHKLIQGEEVSFSPNPIKAWLGSINPQEVIPFDYKYEAETGVSSIANSAEERLKRNYFDPTNVSLKGIIPIVRIIEKDGQTLTFIVRGFACYEIQDVVENKDGYGSKYATNLEPPKVRGTDQNYYQDYDKSASQEDHDGIVIGRLVSDYNYVPDTTFVVDQEGVGNLKYSFLIE